MKHETHTHHIMRDTDSFYVKICGCGVVHLCFGPTTLNLTGHAIIAITETLKGVSQELLSRLNNETIPETQPLSPAEGNVIQIHFPNQ
jgi:hypothetical protein